MKRALLLDDSTRFAATLAESPPLAGWTVTTASHSAAPDALLVDPAWKEWEGLRLLASLNRRFGVGPFPVFAVLREPNAPVEAMLTAFGVSFAAKDQISEPKVMAQLAVLLGNSDSPEFPAWKTAVRDGVTGRADPWPLFAERLLVQGLLPIMTTAPDYKEARACIRHFLMTRFDLAASDIEALLDGGSSVDLEDSRVQMLLEMGLELVRPFLKAWSDLESAAQQVKGIEDVFSRFLPREVIEDLMLKKSNTALLTGEKRRVVALFSHIRDFSHYVEHNEPDVLVDFLNRHFQIYSDIIRKHGGFINKYIGDAVFALFGAPVSYLDNADRALEASIEILQTIGQATPAAIVIPAEGYRIGIGLNEGLAIVGNIGSSNTFDYTAIGDAINLAARLESLNKHYATSLLVSQTFASSLTPRSDRVLRTVDRAKVKGKKTSTTFFTVVPHASDKQERDFLDAYEKALKMIKIGNWLTAEEWLDRALELRPEDPLVHLHRERVRRYRREPPVYWDGAEELTFK